MNCNLFLGRPGRLSAVSFGVYETYEVPYPIAKDFVSFNDGQKDAASILGAAQRTVHCPFPTNQLFVESRHHARKG